MSRVLTITKISFTCPSLCTLLKYGQSVSASKRYNHQKPLLVNDILNSFAGAYLHICHTSYGKEGLSTKRNDYAVK